MPTTYDRVKETTTTAGTGAYTLAGAAAAEYIAFVDVAANGEQVYYAVTNHSDWEVGIGTFTTPDQLARTTILASSNGGAAVNWGSDSKDIWANAPAALLLDTGSAAVATHEAAGDPHPQYLTAAEGDALFLTPAEGNAAYDALGTASAAVAAHEAAGDPHPQYLTPAEGNAAYDALGTAAAAVAAHEAAGDPHTQYHTDARADAWLATKTTTNLAEGTNLYYTDERVDDRVAVLIQNGTGISWAYDDGLGTLTPTVTLAPFTTTNLAEGTNLYYTDARVDARISVFAGTLGTMAYQNANAVAITGGAIDGTTVGATTRATGDFTSITVSQLAAVGATSTIAQRQLYVFRDATDTGAGEQAIYAWTRANNATGSNGKYAGYFLASPGASYAGTSAMYGVLGQVVHNQALSISATMASFVSSLDVSHASAVSTGAWYSYFANPLTNSGGGTVSGASYYAFWASNCSLTLTSKIMFGTNATDGYSFYSSSTASMGHRGSVVLGGTTPLSYAQVYIFSQTSYLSGAGRALNILYNDTDATAAGWGASITNSPNNTSGSNNKYAVAAYIYPGSAYVGTNSFYAFYGDLSSAQARSVAFAASFGTGVVLSAASTYTYITGLQVNTIVNTGGATVTYNIGINIAPQTVGTNIYGIRSQVASSSGRFNLYLDGTADNVIAGNVRVGSTAAPGVTLDITGNIRWSGNATIGDASGDTVTMNAAAWTVANDTTYTRTAGTVANTTVNLISWSSTASGGGASTDLRYYRFAGQIDGTTASAVTQTLTVSSVINATTSPPTSARGIYSYLANTNSGTLPLGVGFAAAYASTSTGVTTSFYGYYQYAPSFTSTGTVGTYGGTYFANANSAKIGTVVGHYVDNQTSMTGNAIAFWSAMNSGTGKWAFYASGTASSAFAGNVRIGSTAAPTVPLDVTGSALIFGTLTVSGAAAIGLDVYGTGRDRLQTEHQGAGSGVYVYTVNNGVTDFEPLRLYGESVALYYRTGVLTAAAGITLDSSGNTTVSGTLTVSGAGGIIITDNVAGLLTVGYYSAGYPWSIIRSGSGASGLELRDYAGNAILSLYDTTKAAVFTGNLTVSGTSITLNGASTTITQTVGDFGVSADDGVDSDLYLNARRTVYLQNAGSNAVSITGLNTTIAGTLTVSGTGTSVFSGVVGIQTAAAPYASGVGQFYIRDSITPTKRLFMGYDLSLDGGYITAEQTTVSNKTLYLQPAGGPTTIAGTLTVSGVGRFQGAYGSPAANTMLLVNNGSSQSQIWALGADTLTTGSLALVVARSDGSSTNTALVIDSSGNTALSGTLTVGAAPYAGASVTIVDNADSNKFAIVRNDNAGASAYSSVVINAYGNSWGWRMGSLAANSNAMAFVVDILGTPAEKFSLTTAGNATLVGTLTAAGITSNLPAESNTVVAAATSGGDKIAIRPRAAGNGGSILVLNSGETDYEPLNLFAEAIVLNYRTGVGTTAAGITLDSSGNTTLAQSLTVSGTFLNVSAGYISAIHTSTNLYLSRSGGGDVMRFTQGTAGSGGWIDSVNAAQTDYEPLTFFAETFNVQLRTGVGTTAAAMDMTTIGILNLRNGVSSGLLLYPSGGVSYNAAIFQNGNNLFVGSNGVGNWTYWTLADGTLIHTKVMGVGSASAVNVSLYVSYAGYSSGVTTGIASYQTMDSASVTVAASQYDAYFNLSGVAAVPVLTAYQANGGVVNSASLTSYRGFSFGQGDISGVTNLFAFVSFLNSGSGRWAFYSAGTANSAFAGNVRIGALTAPTNALDVTGASSITTNLSVGGLVTVGMTTPDGYYQLRITSTGLGFYPAGSGGGSLGLVSNLRPPVAANCYAVDVDASFVTAASGTHPFIASLRVKPFFSAGGATTSIAAGILISPSSSWAAPSPTTVAASLYIANPPTGATSNFAIYVASGETYLNSTLYVTGAVTFTSTVNVSNDLLTVGVGGTPVLGNKLLLRGSSPMYFEMVESTYSQNLFIGLDSTQRGIVGMYSNHMMEIRSNNLTVAMFTAATSAVNGLLFSSRPAGTGPSIGVVGTDANMGINFIGLGTGSHRFYHQGNFLSASLQLSGPGSAVASNGVTITAAASGSNPLIGVADLGGTSDTNISMVFTTKGTGSTLFYSHDGSVFAFAVDTVASAVNRLRVVASATGSAPTLSCSGTDTNVAMIISPQADASIIVSTAGGTAASFRVQNNHASTPNGMWMYFSGASPDNNSQWFIYCQDTTTVRAVCYSDGDWYNHDGTYGTISGREFKSDIVAARTGYLDDIRKIGVFAYTKGGKKMLGPIAEDVREVFPGLAPTIKWNGRAVLGLKESVLYGPVLFSAVKELVYVVDSNTSRIARLEKALSQAGIPIPA